MAPVLPSQAAVQASTAVLLAGTKRAQQGVGLHCVSLSVPAQLGSSKISNMIYSILWHSHVCIKMKGWLLFTNMYGKRLEIIHILDRKTNLWCSKTKHQSFLQEHQKAFITDFHRMFSANRTFGGGKIKSFCIKPSVVTATVTSESSLSNEMLKEKLMAQGKNDKEKKHLGCRGHCCALRAGEHETAEWPDNTLFPSEHWLHKVQDNRVFDSDKIAVFLYSNPSKIQTVIVHIE